MANALLLLADPAEASTLAGGYPCLPPSAVELNLLLEWRRGRSSRAWATIFSASIALHLVLFAVVIRLPGLPPATEDHPVVYKSILLYTPPSLMTQKAPNHHKVTKHIDLADLRASATSQARRASPAPSRRHFEMPKQALVPQPSPKNTRTLPTAPQIALNRPPAPLPGVPNSPIPPAPPPPASPPNPFQDVGIEAPPSGRPKLAPPSSALQTEISNLQHSKSRHMVATDDNRSERMPGSPLSSAANGGPHSAVELQSDPRGADFRPYLARILAIVRANWRLVIPESARIGQLRGRTVIEFIINRDGSIPKLVTADSSGSEPLDRAAVAGLSMSNPLPPLPADFKGFQVRLAFTFAYNMPSQ
ncbi:MAG: TonB family protein [Bryobacteraceae bacterium]